MSSEWPTIEIDKVCTLIVDCVNKTAPVVEQTTPYRMIRTTNIRNGRVDLSSCRFVDETTYIKWTRRASLQYGDVLLTREAPIGEVGFIDKPQGLFLGQRVMQYRADPTVLSPRFLLYSFLSPVLQDQFGSHEGSGSVVSHIRVADCFKFKLKLPPLAVQTEIASLLGALDDRIALLRETNATLEAIAQAMFKSWFVDFDPVRAKAFPPSPSGRGAGGEGAKGVTNHPHPNPLPKGEGVEGMDEATLARGAPVGTPGVPPDPSAAASLFPDGFEESALGLIPKGWRHSTVEQSFILTMGQSPPGDTYNSLGDGLPFYQGRTDFGLRFPTKRIFCNAPTRTAEIGDTLVSVRAPVGDVNMAIERCCLGRGVASVRHPQGYRSFAFYAIRGLRSKFDMYNSEGTVFGSINKKDFQSLPVIQPGSEVLKAFDDIASPLDSRIVENEEQMRTLASLRDTLLPRLISGQLRLPEAEAMLEEVAA